MADSGYAALAVVPADWTVDTALGLSEAAYQACKDAFRTAQRVLIYKASPVNAVVAEGEVIDETLYRLDEWPSVNVRQRPLTGLGQRAEYIMPLRILYQRGEHQYIPASHVRRWLDDPAFPNTEWIPIDQDTYQALTNWP